MVFALLDNATAFFLSLPLLLIYLKSIPQEESLWRWSMPLWLLNYNVIRYFVSDGEIFWVVLCWQLLFLWPISLAIYIHLYNKEKQWAFYIGLKKKHVLIVASLMVLFGGALVYSLYQANKQVIVFHQEVMEELEISSDRQHYLMYNANAPSTLLGVADDIAEVRRGQVYAATLPWSSKVIVHLDNWQKELTYVRFYNGWKLDGLYRESSTEYHNE
ncbi:MULTISPECIES: hypothetical protein [Lysinibacillus]|uniref:hypothetical protein n=1 Tax=Lysinibacillus TaxID=400634 RepID=UPI000569E392|nr:MULTISPECIES: hypothetical protein [Lysinibacillus]WCH45777.1 hypothetical protein NV349_11730 [Lysinibacillus sp. OF-1]